jgi:DNA modification methylase
MITLMKRERIPKSNPAEIKVPSGPKRAYYNDLDLNNWKQYDEILTDSLWNFPARERSSGHKLDYHGNCVPQILTQMLQRYTKSGETMVDFFLGSGTSAIEAHRLHRNCIGIEIQPGMAEYVQEKITELGAADSTRILNADSSDKIWTSKKIQKALREFKLDACHFAFLHPPYADIIRFSTLEKDLSNAESTDAFLDSFQQVAELAFSVLEKGRFAALVIGDKYTAGELSPLGFYCMDRMNRAGFKTKSIIVKNMTGNERGKGRMSNLWRYRALVGGFYLFKHEYVIVFQKS